MKKILYLSAFISCVCFACLCLTACGDDDKDIDRDYTNVHYTLRPGIGLLKFYTIMAYYTDFNGVNHEEEIKDVTVWDYREKKEGTHPIKCRVTATAKTPEEYGEIDAASYDFGWEYSIHWYKMEGGAHSEQPYPSPNYISKDNVVKFLAENPTITLINFSK